MNGNQFNFTSGIFGQNNQNQRISSYEHTLPAFDDEQMNNKNVRHSDVDVGFNPEFRSFESLETIADNVDSKALFALIKSNFNPKNNWTLNFEAVNQVRILYKSMPQDINGIFAEFCEDLKQGLLHSKVVVVKVSLMALNDIYRYASQYKIEWNYTAKFIELLLMQYLHIKPSLKVPLKNCIETLIDSCLGDGLIQILCHFATYIEPQSGIRHDNFRYWGFTYLAHTLNMCKNDVHLFDNQTNMMIFKTIYFVLENQKHGDSKEVARRILKFYHEKMGEQGFQEFLKHLMSSGYLNGKEALKLFENANKNPIQKYERLSVMVSHLKNNTGGPGDDKIY